MADESPADMSQEGGEMHAASEAAPSEEVVRDEASPSRDEHQASRTL